jgi:transcriptional regulator with XRE-family HTH domain
MKKGKTVNNNENFKYRLSEIIVKRGWSQRRLAREIGVTPSTMHLWITGKRKISQNNIIKLSEALGISITDILSESEPMPLVLEVCANVVETSTKPFYRVLVDNSDITKSITKDSHKLIRGLYGAD